MKHRPLCLILFTLIVLLVQADHLPKSLFRLSEWCLWSKSDGKPLAPGEFSKYFHELEGDDAAHHYDTRYAHGVLSYAEKHDAQIHLIRSYLEYFQNHGMETWLAHGTLLGWWWNAHILPWDWDIDTQVSAATIVYLAQHHNSTLYEYTNGPDTVGPAANKTLETVSRQYYLDINPAIHVRRRGSGHNVIDARWIDVRNGLYIDITAVAETHPLDSPGIWSCKNYHHYRTQDLWPMRNTIFEGVVAKIPYAYAKILGEEYGEKALVVEEYQGHRWRADQGLWAKKTSEETRLERWDMHAARRKKQETKAERMKAKQAKKKERLIEKEAREDSARARVRARTRKANSSRTPRRAQDLATEPSNDLTREKMHIMDQVLPPLQVEQSHSRLRQPERDSL